MRRLPRALWVLPLALLTGCCGNDGLGLVGFREDGSLWTLESDGVNATWKSSDGVGRGRHVVRDDMPLRGNPYLAWESPDRTRLVVRTIRQELVELGADGTDVSFGRQFSWYAGRGEHEYLVGLNSEDYFVFSKRGPDGWNTAVASDLYRATGREVVVTVDSAGRAIVVTSGEGLHGYVGLDAAVYDGVTTSTEYDALPGVYERLMVAPRGDDATFFMRAHNTGELHRVAHTDEGWEAELVTSGLYDEWNHPPAFFPLGPDRVVTYAETTDGDPLLLVRTRTTDGWSVVTNTIEAGVLQEYRRLRLSTWNTQALYSPDGVTLHHLTLNADEDAQVRVRTLSDIGVERRDCPTPSD